MMATYCTLDIQSLRSHSRQWWASVQKRVSDFLNGPACFSKSQNPPKNFFFFFLPPHALMMGTGPLRCVLPIILAADYIPHQRWLSASGSEVPSRRRAAAAAYRQCGEFVAFSRLCLHWQTGSSARVCSRGPLFLYSEPALSCARRTGRQTSALTIIELIVFFLCYCPLFQKSPAPQNKSEHLETRAR